jgi:undecaprenyl-diphosphatase
MREQCVTWWQAIILGIVEGLTEYVPVSSTGHLLVTQALLGVGGESDEAKQAADAYAICIQAGAIVAVLGLYFSRVKQMTVGVLGAASIGSGDAEGLRLTGTLLTAFVPAAVIGLTFADWIESHLFGPWPVVAAWFVGGVAILITAWVRRPRDHGAALGLSITELTFRAAAIIGVAQCIAMWPGVSRSLVTIVAGLAVGLSLAAAVEFAFLLGLITLSAATVYAGLKHGHIMLEHYSLTAIVLGFAFAWLSAVIAVKWMVAYLQRHGLALFGWYRIAVAIIVAGLILANVI